MNGIILDSFGGDGQVRELRDTGQGAQVDHVLPSVKSVIVSFP